MWRGLGGMGGRDAFWVLWGMGWGFGVEMVERAGVLVICLCDGRFLNRS